MKISCLGTGYVGLVTGACLADLGHDVICADIDADKILLLREGKIPFYEPGLRDVVQRNVGKARLSFTTDTVLAIKSAEVIFNCVGTPSGEDGSADLQYVFAVAQQVAKHAEGYKILINKSTVPPGTAKKCSEIIETKIKETNSSAKIDVVSNPEFLKEGSAVHDFSHPDKIIVGTESKQALEIMRKLYSGFIRPYMNLLETNWETSEMIKYANNSFLATKISFINEIANISEIMGADIKVVAKAMGMDYRISPKFLNAGLGYGGSCFPKDIRALVNTAKKHGYDARLLQQVDEINKKQKANFLNKITNHFGEDLSGHTFTVWGLSFKPKTSDLREAPSLFIISELLKRGAKISAYDPVAMEEAKALFSENQNQNNIIFHNSIVSSTQDSSAILLVTEWDEFRNLNFSELGKNMKQKMLFDGRNIYDSKLLQDEGFIYHGVGKK